MRKFLFTVAFGAIIFAACTPSTVELPIIETPPSAVPHYQCEDQLGCVSIAPESPIHIAWIQSVSGSTGPLGVTNVRGAEVALNEIGFQLLGRSIQWDGIDGGCSMEGGQVAAEEIVADPTIVGVIGGTCSAEVLGAMPVLSQSGLVMISPSAVDPDLTGAKFQSGFSRTAHNAFQQGEIAAQFALSQLGLTSAATVNDGRSITQGLQQAFTENFLALGGSLTAQETVTLGEVDMSALLTKLGATRPQVIFMPLFEPEGIHIVSQKCTIVGLENTALIAADGLLINSLPSKAGNCALGMYLIGTYIDPAVQADFLNTYAQLFGEGPASAFAPHSYDAIKLLLAAIQQVAVTDIDGTLYIPRQALRDALYAMSGFSGLTGTLSCSINGDCASGQALAVFQVTQENLDGTADLLTNRPVWTPAR